MFDRCMLSIPVSDSPTLWRLIGMQNECCDVFSLPEGPLEIRCPFVMSPESLDEVQEFLELWVETRRRATIPAPATAETGTPDEAKK